MRTWSPHEDCSLVLHCFRSIEDLRRSTAYRIFAQIGEIFNNFAQLGENLPFFRQHGRISFRIFILFFFLFRLSFFFNWAKETTMKANTYLIINRYQRSRTADRRPYVTLACERGVHRKYTMSLPRLRKIGCRGEKRWSNFFTLALKGVIRSSIETASRTTYLVILSLHTLHQLQ
ncbi:hypothetical protein M9H77_34803 [Catharanthus roseus]|uniref:Uncharacterized protein n=1 Tax=Catharanthus roseus TaxID=4058 RepID=A0ACB9ZMH6_CATRO|nr:hypothetical protein M9H77_34803 [Catharanthus roseus]